ncbi:hypothetical protein JCM11251_002448, partial [Rhodosporidiobolus azoricus]
PPPLPWPHLEEDEAWSAIRSARPFTAAGPNNVPNIILHNCWPTLRTRLVPLYAAILRTGFIPRAWRDAIAVVLKKPKKDDYSNPKAYRLIAFKRCVAKGLESIVARRFEYLAEVFQLLPPEHAGGRRGRSAQDVVACVVDMIQRQGSPLSPILFILYNAALLHAANTPCSCGFGWIDAVNVLAWGPSVRAGVAAAQALIPRLEDWSDTHRSAFEPEKTSVTIFHPAHRCIPPN